MSDLPTKQFATPTGVSAAATPSRALIALGVIAGALLLAVVALVFLALGQRMGGDSASIVAAPTPTAAASNGVDPSPSAAEDEVDEEPVDNSTRFTSFTAPTTVLCDPDAEEKPKIQVAWTSVNGETAWFAPDDGDASDGTGYQIPLSGNQDNITDNDHEFPCQHRGEQDYTLTLVGPDGTKVHEHWTVVDPDFGN